MIHADLHIHSIYSSDSSITPKALVEQLLAHNLVKVAALTDHDTIEGCVFTRQLASSYPDILIIPGVEISTQEGDIVVLGAEEMPPHPWTAENIVDFARSTGSVSIAAHPYREYGMGDKAKNYKIDAVEILNGCSPSSANKAAQSLAELMGVPGVAGSDAHQPSELLSVYTQIEASLDVDEILKAIRKGSVSIPPFGQSIRF
ncbi:TPA: PHP domain-containing protein [Candidatus Bathyarchaeota archaeon]|nr:PHP domain-containing protein [Candidatus Bathyarchaeota archaeon]HIJ08214.1 PHP domain-containing protein [Candidatus Bathyarchaeota archaeon]